MQHFASDNCAGKGLLHKGDDDFWRFQSHPGVMLTCKDCRQIAEKLSALNVL